jgi:FAD/FMN-containing dehydrogenase
LFWALKGGGGGTFGVVTRVTLRTHALPQYFGGAWGSIKAQTDAAFQRLIARFIAFYSEKLCNAHWGGNVGIGPDNLLDIAMASQGLDNSQASAAWQPFFAWVDASPNDLTVVRPFHTDAGDPRMLWDVDRNPFWTRDPREGAPRHHAWGKGDQGEVGAFLHGYDSLWLPATLLREARRNQLADALFAASRYKLVRLHLGKGLAGAPPEVRAAVLQTATNPAVVDAFTLAIIADGEAPAYPGLPRPRLDVAAARRDAHAIDLAAAALRRIAPGSGSYVPESNYFNLDWQSEYWGGHYARLQAIKQKYDPDGLFYVRHGVGSENWSGDGFTRIG